MHQLSPVSPTAFSAATTLTILIVLSGCSLPASNRGYLSVPQSNTVRLLPGHSNALTPDRLHWTWSILGERNWTKAQASDLTLALSDAYPLNDVQRMHGTNTWNCDLAAERRAADAGSAHWTLTLHGSNGVTAESTGIVALKGKDLDSVFVPVQTTDGSSGLPATFTLARINDADVSVTLSQ